MHITAKLGFKVRRSTMNLYNGERILRCQLYMGRGRFDGYGGSSRKSEQAIQTIWTRNSCAVSSSWGPNMSLYSHNGGADFLRATASSRYMSRLDCHKMALDSQRSCIQLFETGSLRIPQKAGVPWVVADQE